MDLPTRQELHATIEKMTHSGNSTLDREDLKKLKSICKQSDTNVRTAYELLMHTLHENHAEVRLSTFQVMSDLFTRSSVFRELLTTDFKTFAGLVTGTDTKQPLPPPKEAAARLKKSSLLAIREWNQRYSHGYPNLKLGFNFLKFNKKVDFEQLMAQSEAERRRREERETRQRAILQQRIQEVKQEMTELRCEIDGCLREVESCYNLLLPRFEFDIYSTTSQDTTSQDSISQDSASNQASISASNQISQDSKLAASGLRSRKRTVSSGGSFVSLSEGESDSEASDGEGEGGVVADGDKHPRGGINPGSSNQIKDGGHSSTGMDLDPGSSQSAGLVPNSDSNSDSDSDVEWEDVEPSGEEGWGSEMQEHGLAAAHSFSVPVRLSRHVEVRETDDNTSILATLHERRQLLLHHHLPTLNKCLEWMTKAGESESVRSAIDLKDRINSAMAKYGRLNIVFRNPPPEEKPASSDEETKQDSAQQQPSQRTDPEWKFGTEVPASVPMADLELDPTTPQAQLARLKKKLRKPVPPPSSAAESAECRSSSTAEPGSSMECGSGSSSAHLLAKAPVVPFGMDLYHWENSSATVEPRTLAPIGSLHRFWAQETEVNISKDEQDRLKCRTISFPGEFQPVAKSCRAPLPSGKLCLRRDRYKCPFHGTIIPRDELGQPVSGGRDAGTSVSSSDQPPLWQDEELQREVMSAKGIDLQDKAKKGKGKGGGGRKKTKFPGLTDLKQQVDTPRKRLERKVLSKRALRRVADSVNELATKKYNDKFGNNFNYALKN